jgi:formate hydrogenlyase subunit 6/NADH:ubiquinone oxidoreductase subunit I
VCLHCGRCVDFCPHNCLEFDDVDPLTRSLYDD